MAHRTRRKRVRAKSKSAQRTVARPVFSLYSGGSKLEGVKIFDSKLTYCGIWVPDGPIKIRGTIKPWVIPNIDRSVMMNIATATGKTVAEVEAAIELVANHILQ